MTRILVSLFVLVACAFSLAAQDFRATIVGRVTDSSGAIVAGARVSATNVNTGAVTNTVTNGSGSYVLPALPPGSYKVEIEMAGFKRFLRDGITLEVQERPTLDAVLEPGESSTTISVTGDAPLVETSNASRGSTVTGRTLVDLPLNGRNAFALAGLDPGVNSTARGQATTFFRTTANNGISGFSFSGGALLSNESLLDGIPNTGSDGLIQYVPSVDATQEFRVQTNSFDAEYGRFTGGVLNAVIKSGTNQLHGTLFNFTRNSYWNARDPFATSIPQFGYNLFGGAVGGPVWIPKLYNGRNRTFFFFSYEGSREGVPRANVSTVPTDLQRAGDFSQTRVRSGSSSLPVTIYDPLTTQTTSSGSTRLPFPGNRIPDSQINPLSRKLLALYPLANAPGDSVTGASNFLLSFKDPVSDDGYVVKVDHRFSDRHSVFGRYSFRQFNVGRQGAFKNPVTGDAEQRKAPGVALDDTYLINSTTVLNIRYGLSRFFVTSAADNVGIDLAGLGFQPSYASLLSVQAIPQISISNLATISGSNKLNRSAETVQTVRGTLSKVIGKHSLRTGAEFRLLDSNAGNLGSAAAGAFAFDQAFTRGPNPQVAAVNSGVGLASFLLGFPASGNVTNIVASADRTTYYGVFLQDDFRVTSKLTLNLGLRYEIEGPYTERYNRLNRGFDSTTVSPIAAQVKANYAANPIADLAPSQFNVLGGLLFAGVGNQPRSLANLDTNNIAPRIGVAYQLTPRTVLRGGYGLFYGASTQTGETRNGFSITTAYVASTDGGLRPANSLSNPFPTGLLAPAGSADGLLTQVGQSIGFTSPDRHQPRAQQYTFGFQRQLAAELVAEVTYVGSKIDDLPVNRQINGIPETFRAAAQQTFFQTGRNPLNDAVANPFFGVITSGTLAARTVTRGQLLRPFPQFTSVSGGSLPLGSSNYNSLQLKLNKRFSAGFSMTASYAYSKQLEETRFLNDQDTQLTRELNGFDIPQRLVVSGAYELPIGPGKRLLSHTRGVVGRLVEGWQINGIYQAQSGIPLDISGAESTGTSAKLDSGKQTVARWFDTSAFRLRQSIELTHTVRLSDVRSAGRNNVDLSVFKNIRLNEQARLQFRAEAFNAFNRPEYSSPNTSFGSATFGQVTGTNTFARQLQFALKLLW